MIAIALLAACADPVVEMQLVLPQNAEGFATSCITAVEVRANGTTFPQDPRDRRRSCLEINAGSTYESVRDAIRGEFTLAIPETGLSGIELYGWSGPAACREDLPRYVTPDLLFFGKGDYIGQDRIDIPLVPNLGCAAGDLRIRIVDMFALIRGATCAAAMSVPDDEGGAGIGTLVPKLYGKGSRWFGNLAWNLTSDNIAAFRGLVQVGPKSCLAVDGSTFTGASTGCVIGGPSVCAGPGEIEHASIDVSVLGVISNFDATLMVKFPGIVIGSVWNTEQMPIAGAKVEIDPKRGKVVYVDPPPPGSGVLATRADQSGTGPSGLFVLYTDTVASVKVIAGAQSRTVTLGSADESIAAAMIVMSR